MAILTKFELTPKEKTGTELIDFLQRIIPATRSYQGCTGASFGLSQKPPKTVLLIEEWDSLQDFEAYLNWRVERSDFATLTSLLASDPIVTHFERG